MISMTCSFQALARRILDAAARRASCEDLTGQSIFDLIDMLGRCSALGRFPGLLPAALRATVASVRAATIPSMEYAMAIARSARF
jgi:hypothetical protein